VTVVNRNEPLLLPSSVLRNAADLTVSVRNPQQRPSASSSNVSSLSLPSTTIVNPRAVPSSSSLDTSSSAALEIARASDLDPAIQRHIARIKETRAERTRQARDRAASSGASGTAGSVLPECNVSSSLVRQIASESTKKLCERFAAN
jgi:hypothetical protein